MADNPALDSFLATGAQGEAAQPAQEPPQAPEPAAAPEPQHDAQKPSEAKPEAPAAKEPEEDVQPASGEDNRTVAFSALEKIRNDWRSKAAAAETEAKLLREQLEEFKRAQQAPAPQPAPPPQFQLPPMPDPQTDLYGYLRYQEVVRQRELLNERLNLSEAFITDKIGEDKLREYVTEFKQHADKDQSLWGKLYNQPNPYGWMAREIDRLRQRAEIGDDPAAYRERIIAAERAKWEAEAAQLQPQAGNGAPRPSPVAGMAPSLANARSVAGRSSPSFTGPPPLEDLFPGHNRRAQQQRH
jgi:hypothetical protein